MESATNLRRPWPSTTLRKGSNVACICWNSWLPMRHFRKGHPVNKSGSNGLEKHNLGQTRSSHHRNHLLLTPDTFVRTPLPGMKSCTAIVHIGPALGAAFTQYTAEFELGGELGLTSAQRFLFVLEGALSVDASGARQEVAPGGYAFFPQGLPHRVTSSKVSRVAVIEK